MERLAIMGGTFDPIHMGHLRMAHAVQRHMVKLAIKEYEDFVVSSLEFDRGGLSYTYDTVNVMQEMWPDADIYLIIGEDSLTQLYTWYRVQDLLRLVYFVAAERPGYEGEAGVERLTRAYGSWAAEKIIHAEVPETAISSTEIRKRLREGKPIRGMVPLAVERYIFEHGLYRAET